MRLRQIILLLLLPLLLTIGISGNAWTGTLVLIANPSVASAILSRQEVKNIFLSKKKNLKGVQIKLAALKDDDLTKQFLRAYIGKTPSQFSSYYKKMVFTGRGRPPKPMQSEQEMITYVARTNGAMGYVSAEMVTDRVQIVKVKD